MSTGTRPHMLRLPEETDEQHRERLSRSCYRCGWYTTDQEQLDGHEDVCGGGA